MSAVPPWKQVIYDRRKKQGEEEKRKKSEDEAYLASLPPWKRALVLRQREKKGHEAPSSPVERSDSFSKWPLSPPKKEDTFWVKASAGGERTSSTSPVNIQATPVSNQPTGRHGSRPKAAATPYSRKASPEPMPTSGPVFLRARAASVPTYVKDKRRSFEEEDLKFANMPAWKKALIMRRKASQSGESNKPERKKPQVTDSKSNVVPDSSKLATTQKPTLATRKSQSEPVMRSTPGVDERNAAVSQERARSPPYSVPSATKPVSQERARSPPYSVPSATKPVSQERARSPPYSVPSATKPLSQERARSPPYSVPSATKPLSQERARSPPYSVPSATKPLSQERARSPPYSVPSATKPLSQERARSPPYSVPSATKPVSQERARSPPYSVAKPSSTTKTTIRKPAPPPPLHHIPKRSAPPPPISKATSKPEPKRSSNLSNKKLPTTPTSKPQPEIVNRSPSEAQPNKLVEKEGITLHPPVFKEVEQWANVTENDPKFQNLPQWKQALIRRRRADIAKRTASPSESPSPTEKVHVHTPWSPRSSLDAAKAADIPKWKQDVFKRKQEVLANPVNIGLESDEKDQPKNMRRGNVKALLDRFNKGPPQYTITNYVRSQSPPKETRQAAVIPITPSGDSSDEELEEIPLTSIDDELSTEETDEDDSGIVAKRRASDLGPPPQPPLPGGDGSKLALPPRLLSHRPLSPSGNSAPAILIEERRPSILIDPENRPMKGLRRVSFSEAALVQEHVYPKYDYKDYETLSEDDEEGSVGENLGLAQRLHPSLRPTSPDKDPYSNSPVKQISSPETDLHRYTPKSISSYEDEIQQHLSGHYSLSYQEEQSHAAEESSDGMPLSEDQVDFYATLNSDDAALMW